MQERFLKMVRQHAIVALQHNVNAEILLCRIGVIDHDNGFTFFSQCI